MQLRQLECVLALAEELDLVRAAARLGVEPDELGQQIAGLERELGAALVDRSAASLALTAAGARFVVAAQAVLDAVSRARESVMDDRPRLSIGTSTGLDERVGRLRARLGDSVLVEFVTSSTYVRLEGVRTGRLDATFVWGEVELADLEVVPIWSDPLMAVLPATHPLAEQSTVSIFDLLDLPLCIVARALNPPLVDLIEQTCRRLGFQPERARPSGGLDESLATVGSGAPVWTVVYDTQARAGDDAHLAYRQFDPPLAMPTSLARAPGPGSGPLTALLAACAQLAAD